MIYSKYFKRYNAVPEANQTIVYFIYFVAHLKDFVLCYSKRRKIYINVINQTLSLPNR